ncbi:MAG: tryptophan--tRNA ligase [Myxococcota bacterium]|nr:tryptophan--tRNA ligase [Myxococcota bacterium]
MKRRALTGIQPSGTPHVGNWLGAIEPALALSESCEGYYFIASYHALTTSRDPELLRQRILDVAATWLALGLDPTKTVLWTQQDVPEVTELAWILSCMASKGLLDKAHAFKDAVTKGKKFVSAGLYTYPILMAADILAFDSDLVPVGRDQKQHVEMARDMAQRLNHVYGELLKLPEPLIQDSVAVVPGTDGQKMSKSYSNTVPLFLPPKKLRKVLMSIKTDSKTLEEAKDPDTCTVFALYKLFATAAQQQDLAARYRQGGLGYGHAKQELFVLMNDRLASPRDRYNELMARPDDIRDILTDGALRARVTARATLDRVRGGVGL